VGDSLAFSPQPTRSLYRNPFSDLSKFFSVSRKTDTLQRTAGRGAYDLQPTAGHLSSTSGVKGGIEGKEENEARNFCSISGFDLPSRRALESALVQPSRDVSRTEEANILMSTVGLCV